MHEYNYTDDWTIGPVHGLTNEELLLAKKDQYFIDYLNSVYKSDSRAVMTTSDASQDNYSQELYDAITITATGFTLDLSFLSDINRPIHLYYERNGQYI